MNTNNYVVWKIEFRQDTEFLMQTKPYSKFGKLERAHKYTLKQAIKIVRSFRKDFRPMTSTNYGYDRVDSVNSIEKIQDLDNPAMRTAIVTVWGQIGFDVENNLGDELTNIIAVETCIDADHLVTFASAQKQENLLNDAVRVFGYVPVLKFLSKKIKLV
jgi:hypothetical protein